MDFYFNEYIGEQMVAFNSEENNLTEVMRHLTENKIQGVITSFIPEKQLFEVSFPGYGEYSYPAVQSIPYITSL